MRQNPNAKVSLLKILSKCEQKCATDILEDETDYHIHQFLEPNCLPTLIRSNLEENMQRFRDVISPEFLDIHIKYSINVFMNLCRTHDVDFNNINLDFNDFKKFGLIGPGDSCLTSILERLFGKFPSMRLHAILHDAYGAFYRSTGKSNGYFYRSRKKNLAHFVKNSPLIGHITGIFYCYNFIHS